MVILVEPREYLSDAEASRNTGLQSGVQVCGRQEGSNGIQKKLQSQLSNFQELMGIGEGETLPAALQQQSLHYWRMRLEKIRILF